MFDEYDADVLVHPVIGPTKEDDISAYVRKQTYDVLAKQLDHVKFEYLPYSMMVRICLFFCCEILVCRRLERFTHASVCCREASVCYVLSLLCDTQRFGHTASLM